MRIAIISSANLMHMTLISNYLDIIDFDEHSVDIIYMDKYGIEEEIEVTNKYKYFTNIKPTDKRFSKLRKYYGFKKFVEKKLVENKYDLFIIWNSYTAQLLGISFFKKIKNKYILNIRDYTYENNKIIFNRIKFIIDNSIFTTISSEGFNRFLPESEKIIMMHSLNKSILSDIARKSKSELPLKISFLGNVRFYDENIKLIQTFKRDNRFTLHYYGVGDVPLKKYCKENNISNVFFHGPFNPNETMKILSETDIINNYYGNENIALTTALSIRLYYSVFLEKPIIVTPGTYTSELAQMLKIGFSEELTNEYPDNLFEWYKQIDKESIQKNRNQFLEKIENDNQFFREKVKGILKNEL